MTQPIDNVRQYWESHLNLTQFITNTKVEVGSDEFFRLLGQSLHRYEYKIPLLKGLADGRKGQTLLEVGCGLGLELAYLGALGFQVTGIDLAPKAVEVANGYLAKKGIAGNAFVANAEKLDFPDESCDVVYSSGVLQHTPQIDRAIAEIWRVLKPGGRILIILYHRRSWFYLLHRLSGVNVEFQSDDAPIVNAYTRRELQALFSKFRDIQINCEYYRPICTVRGGILATLYNGIFVRMMNAMPNKLIKPFGWHLVLSAGK